MKQLAKLLTLALTGLFLSTPPAIAQSPPPTGEDLFNAFGCRGCHFVAGSGGSLGPALDGVSERLSRQQLRTALTIPRKDSAMPSFGYLTASELDALLAYLGAL